MTEHVAYLLEKKHNLISISSNGRGIFYFIGADGHKNLAIAGEKGIAGFTRDQVVHLINELPDILALYL